jgi:CBS domain-containing protein
VNIGLVLEQTPASTLDLSRFVAVAREVTVADVVRSMSDRALSCAIVVEDGAPVGIFTQRDVLLRVIGRPSNWDRPIADEMTRPVRTLGLDQSVAAGLTLMSDWWVRNVPVVDRDGKLEGNLSFFVVMKTMADLLEARLGESGARPEVQHGLQYVDFTGMNTNPPVTVRVDQTADVAAHQMSARGIGSVLVVDDRERLAGVLTEFDLQMKIGCERSDLSNILVEDIMTPEPVALGARTPIAGAIRQMAEHGFAHIPLLGESGRPVAVTSFRDIAGYVESSLEALG